MMRKKAKEMSFGVGWRERGKLRTGREKKREEDEKKFLHTFLKKNQVTSCFNVRS